MKLHLPVALLSALFAVLSASRSSAEVSFEYERSGSSGAGLSGDNIIQKGTYQDVTLTIQKGDSEDEVCVKVAPEGDDYGSVLFVGDNNQITVGSGCVLEICRGKHGVPGTFLGYLPYGRGASGRTTIDLSGELRWSDSYPDMQGNTPPDLFNAVAGTLTGIIKIHQGGTLNCARKDGKTLTLSRAAGGRGGCEMITNIEVEEGGEFRAGSVIVGEAQAFNGTETTCTATTTLTLKGGEYNGEETGSDTLGKGARNPAYATTSGKDILTTTIRIESGGKYWGGDFSRIADTSEVDNETSTVLINVDGKNSMFTTKGDIGIVSKGTSSGVTIKVTNGGEFVLHSKTTGEAATVNTSAVPDQVGKCSTTITVSDAVFTIAGAATIGMEGVSEASITICGGSTFKLDYTDEETNPTTIYADVVMAGGKLELSNKALTSDYQKAAFQRGVFVRSDVSDTLVTVDLGGLDASLVKQVSLTNAGDSGIVGLMKDTTLTFRKGDQMVVGKQHVYRKGQTELAGETMVQFQEGGGQIAFGEAGKLQLHLKSEVLEGLEGQLEILFTNGSFSGMPEGGQKELEAWLGEHFVLDAGLPVLLLSGAEGGRLILTGSSSGIWIASRNGQNVDVADLLNHYSAVIADEDLTLTLPATQEETPTIVNQLQNEREKHGDFIVKTESGATANHTVQLHSENADGDNGDKFYGDVRVEGTGLEAATLEKTGDAALNVHGNVESSGTVEVKGGTLALGGTANSIGTLAMSGGKLQVDGTLELTGVTEMSEESHGSISGKGNVKLGSGASLTLAGGVSYEVQNTQLENGAQMSQKGEAAIKGGSIKLSGEGTGYTQAGGTIGGATFTLTEGTSFTQAGGSIGEGATFSLKDGAKLTLKGGSMNGAVTMEGEASLYDLGNQAAEGSITMHGGNLANAGSYVGTLAIQTDDTYTGALDLGGVDAARITQVQIGASGTELRNLKSGSTLTFREGDAMVVGVQHVYREGQTELAGGTMVQFRDGKGQIAFGEAGKLQLRLENEVLKDIEGQLEILFTNGSFSGMPEGGQKELEAWLKEHFVLETGLDGIKVLLLSDAEGGHLILTGSTEGVWIASRNGQNVDVADLLNNYSAVIVDKDLTLTLPTTQEETPTTIVHQLRSDEKTHGDFIVKTESGATAGHTVQLHNENTNGDNGGTNFYGNIRVEGTGLEAATLEKTGDAALNVHGNLESSGTVEVKEGTLALSGGANSIGTLAMSGGKLQVDGTLALTGATEMSEESSGSISGKGNVKLGSGASLTLAGGVSYGVQNTQLENGAQMSQKGEAAIKGGSITLGGEGTGYTQASGTISGATFTLTEGASFAQAGGSIDGGAAFSLSDGANLTQSNGTINDTSVTLSGGGTGYTQASGTISGATFTLTEGASFAQAGGDIGGGAAFSLSDGANLTQSKGAIDGASITLSGSASMRQDGGQITGGTLDLSGGATMTQSNGTINGTSVTLSGEGTGYTQEGGSIGEGAKFSLGEGAKLTLSGGSMNGAVTMEGKTSHYDLGNQAAQGDITMHGGSLANAGNYAGSLAIQTGDTYTGAVDLGGVDAARITSIQLAGKDTYLTGLKEGSTLTLHAGDSFKVTEQNVWVDGKDTPEGKQAFFQFGTAGAGEVGTGSVVDVASGATITLNFVGQQIAEAVREDGSTTLKVWITNGQLGGRKTEDAGKTWAEEHFEIGTGWGLKVESYDAAQGMLVLKGQSNIWDAKADGEQVNGHAEANARDLDSAEKVIIDENTVVAVDQDATIHQLDGEGKYSLRLKNDGEDDKTITLRNHGSSSSAMGSAGDTVFGGDILAGGGVNLQKTGDAALEVQGSLKAEGNVAVEEGKLAIGGNDSFIDGELSLGDKENDKRGELQVDGKLTLSQRQNLTGSQGSITGNGTVVLDGDFTVGDVELGKDLTFQMGEKAASANFGDKAVTLQDLEGEKNVTAREGVTLTGEGTFSGAINGDTTMQGEYALNGANIDGTLDNSGEESVMILSDASKEPLQVQKDLVLRKNATTRIFMDLSNGDLWQGGANDTMVSVSRNIIIEDGTIFEIHNLKDIIASNEDLKNVVIMRGAHVYAVHEKYTDREQLKDDGSIRTQQIDKDVKVKLTGTLNWRYKEAYVSFMNSEAAVAEAREKRIALFRQATPAAETKKLGSTVSLTLRDQDVNPVIAFAETFNEKAGAALVSGHVLRSSINGVDPDVERMAEFIAGAMESNPAVAHRTLAAMAGSTLTSVSAAQSAALRNQTSRVRDHALQAARLRCQGNDEATQQQHPCKTTHVWVEGTSFFSEQHSTGDESGYRLNSWGGAVGIDAQVNAHWSVGLSLAANYGDLEARAADYAKGDLDSYYVSAWSQAKNGRWGNTLLFTVGTNEADLRRTVNYGAGSYTATSNASGSSLGAMWELTCDFHPVKENKSNILQPLFNVAVQHTSMDGFSEKNAGNVGLAAEKQTRDTMTLGLGLRWLAAIDSAKAVNRTVSTELHANVAQDLGDRRSVANVALLADPNYTQSVYGSKTGSTAFQFGAGVNVPMTPNSCIYVNAGGELREHANTWNATLGVRMGF